MYAAQIVALAAVAVAAAAAFPTGHIEEHHAPAPYSYKYSVHDPHHGDVKSHHESRHGDQVKGSYTVVEPDGHVRKVEYTADKHNGFQAIVTREGKVSLHGYGDHDTQDLGGHHAAAPAPAHGHHFAAGHGAGFGAGFGAGQGAGVGAGAGAGHGHLAGLSGVHFSGHGDAAGLGAGHGAGYGAGYGAGFGAGHGHHF